MIRYKIRKDRTCFYLAKDCECEQIIFDHDRHIYFVDILEKKDQLCKMRIYMPDGRLIEGWQLIWDVELHHIGDVFDGRFNTISICESTQSSCKSTQSCCESTQSSCESIQSSK